MLALNESVRVDTPLLFHLLLDTLPNSAAALFDDTLRVVCAGGELLPAFGFGSNIDGRHVTELFGHSEAELLARWFATALSGQPLTTTWLLREKMLSVTVRRVHAFGTPPYAAMFVQELQPPAAAEPQDEQKRATVAKDLETAQVRARLVERILHEFRNPLAAVASSAEILERYGQSMTNDRREKHVARIGEEIHRLSEILDNILTLFS